MREKCSHFLVSRWRASDAKTYGCAGTLVAGGTSPGESSPAGALRCARSPSVAVRGGESHACGGGGKLSRCPSADAAALVGEDDAAACAEAEGGAAAWRA